jgi:hypothetical protein
MRSLLLTMLLVGCGGAPPVGMTCHAISDPLPGSPTTAAIELRNDTAVTITLTGATVPWLYRHAGHFSAPGFSDPHVIAEPGHYEPIILPPGQTAGGEIALHDRLVDSFGRAIDQLPGTHEVTLRTRLELDPGSTNRRHADAQCTFPVEVRAMHAP